MSLQKTYKMKILTDILKLRDEAEREISTLPALMMTAEEISESVIHGMHSQGKSGAGEKFWQFKEYQGTDRPQDIDWRQSAKSDTIFTKQKEWQTSQKTYIWCASGSSMDFKSSNKIYRKQACAQIISMSLALLLRRSDEQIGLFGDLKTGNSEDKMHKIADILLNKSNIDNKLPNLNDFALPNHASFIGISDFLSDIDKISDNFARILHSTKSAIIIQILDPAEIELPYKGRVSFKPNHDDDGYVINNVASIRGEYKNRMEIHINNVKSLCNELGWHYILHKTDSEITKTLESIWIMIEGKK